MMMYSIIPFYSIVLFIIVFSILYMIKPAFVFNSDGSLKEFGVGYRNKTILPIWLLSIIFGILSYVAVMFYMKHIQ